MNLQAVFWRSSTAFSDSSTRFATVNGDRVTGLYAVRMTNFHIAALGAGCIERAMRCSSTKGRARFLVRQA